MPQLSMLQQLQLQALISSAGRTREFYPFRDWLLRNVPEGPIPGAPVPREPVQGPSLLARLTNQEQRTIEGLNAFRATPGSGAPGNPLAPRPGWEVGAKEVWKTNDSHARLQRFMRTGQADGGALGNAAPRPNVAQALPTQQGSATPIPLSLSPMIPDEQVRIGSLPRPQIKDPGFPEGLRAVKVNPPRGAPAGAGQGMEGIPKQMFQGIPERPSQMQMLAELGRTKYKDRPLRLTSPLGPALSKYREVEGVIKDPMQLPAKNPSYTTEFDVPNEAPAGIEMLQKKGSRETTYQGMMPRIGGGKPDYGMSQFILQDNPHRLQQDLKAAGAGWRINRGGTPVKVDPVAEVGMWAERFEEEMKLANGNKGVPFSELPAEQQKIIKWLGAEVPSLTEKGKMVSNKKALIDAFTGGIKELSKNEALNLSPAQVDQMVAKYPQMLALVQERLYFNLQRSKGEAGVWAEKAMQAFHQGKVVEALHASSVGGILAMGGRDEETRRILDNTKALYQSAARGSNPWTDTDIRNLKNSDKDTWDEKRLGGDDSGAEVMDQRTNMRKQLDDEVEGARSKGIVAEEEKAARGVVKRGSLYPGEQSLSTMNEARTARKPLSLVEVGRRWSKREAAELEAQNGSPLGRLPYLKRKVDLTDPSSKRSGHRIVMKESGIGRLMSEGRERAAIEASQEFNKYDGLARKPLNKQQRINAWGLRKQITQGKVVDRGLQDLITEAGSTHEEVGRVLAGVARAKNVKQVKSALGLITKRTGQTNIFTGEVAAEVVPAARKLGLVLLKLIRMV
jgi:hypothetical protein